MGQDPIADRIDQEQLRRFSRALLDDVRALGRMCERGLIESGVRRIGAEQELFLIDRTGRPAMINAQVLARLAEPEFTTELGLFNMEFNVPARPLDGSCLGDLEDALTAAVARAAVAAHAEGGEVLLTGILPTLVRGDLTLENMTPLPRYFELNRVMTELSHGVFRTQIMGVDELHMTHRNVMLEACNTSFQVHFQVGADEFARLYNLAQVVTAPVLAAAVNSPVLLQHRLWHETRVALFEQSLDFRSEQQKLRGSRRRVSFGDKWVDDSVVELYREQVARYRVLLAADLGEASTSVLERGEIPPLTALCLHNGTVYRWNRPCFGVHDGHAHLRIENRALPAGPTVLDEVANAAFYFGLMSQLGKDDDDVRTQFAFEDAKSNFVAAARYGLKATLRWRGGRAVPVPELIRGELLPQAREGLRRHRIDETHIDRYLGVIDARVASGRTGAQWSLDLLSRLSGVRKASARDQTLTLRMLANHRSGQPVHTWDLPDDVPDVDEWRESVRTVGQLMTTDLFTVQPEDLVDVAAAVMHWEHLRHVPVEDDHGRLVGLLSHRSLLKMIAQGAGPDDAKPTAVREIMQPDPVTVSPDMPCLDAMRLMRTHKVGCLPVVQDGNLVGVVSERDFIEMAARLFEEYLSDGGRDAS